MNRRTGLVLTAVAVFVLVFALAGTSYAASKGQKAHASATKKHKKPKPKRGPAGPAGPTGSTGPTGKEGPAGKEGKEGKEGKQGKEGPSGVLEMTNLNLVSSANPSGTPAFMGATTTVNFDAKTAVHISASIDVTAVAVNTVAEGFFSTCYQAEGASAPTSVTYLEPVFESATGGRYMVVSIAGVIKGLTPGSYKVGACSYAETNIAHGFGWATAIVAETP
jgi:Collagen triple helix repeat (20 copies)